MELKLLSLWIKSFNATIHVKATKWYFHMVLFILLLFNNLKFRISIKLVDWGYSFQKAVVLPELLRNLNVEKTK